MPALPDNRPWLLLASGSLAGLSALKARCYSCHGALKQQAELRLDSGEAIRRGGKHGPVMLTNEVAKSPLLLRVTSTNSDER